MLKALWKSQESYNPIKILSTCPEFRSMSELSAKKFFQGISFFKASVEKYALVPEEIFDDYFEHDEEIDTAPKKSNGKGLNDLTTNRQRSMIINHPSWLETIGNRKAATKTAKGARKAIIKDADNIKECEQGINVENKQKKRKSVETPTAQWNSLKVCWARGGKNAVKNIVGIYIVIEKLVLRCDVST
mmetsp:Transcript_23843/g.32663  ORF Transcript_23843/g.32663 Transcript_23843/m.32663 type:complete len:188 (+) Transcript_23843:186-749(+)